MLWLLFFKCHVPSEFRQSSLSSCSFSSLSLTYHAFFRKIVWWFPIAFFMVLSSEFSFSSGYRQSWISTDPFSLSLMKCFLGKDGGRVPHCFSYKIWMQPNITIMEESVLIMIHKPSHSLCHIKSFIGRSLLMPSKMMGHFVKFIHVHLKISLPNCYINMF